MLPAIKTIYWTKDGKQLEMEDGGEKYSEVNTRNPSLTIHNVNQHDAGTYRLTATNAVGTTSSEIVLGNTIGVKEICFLFSKKNVMSDVNACISSVLTLCVNIFYILFIF